MGGGKRGEGWRGEGWREVGWSCEGWVGKEWRDRYDFCTATIFFTRTVLKLFNAISGHNFVIFRASRKKLSTARNLLRAVPFNIVWGVGCRPIIHVGGEVKNKIDVGGGGKNGPKKRM